MSVYLALHCILICEYCKSDVSRHGQEPITNTPSQVRDFRDAYSQVLGDGDELVVRDGTEHGVARDLLEAGVPKDRIALAFRSPDSRQNTEFAVA